MYTLFTFEAGVGRLWLSEFYDMDEALDIGSIWADLHPKAIVSLVEYQAAVCDNCYLPIRQAVGSVLYRWIHSHDWSLACYVPGYPPARPKAGTIDA